MALKDVFGFFKEGLEDRFNTRPRDPVAARRPLLRGIDNALEQFRAGRTRVPRRWWTASNGVVAFSPNLNGTPLVLNGKTTNHVASDDFPGFLDAFRDAVNAGELDAEITAIESGRGNAGHSVPVQAKRRTGSISPEAAKARGQKAAESRRRNRLEREAAGD